MHFCFTADWVCDSIFDLDGARLAAHGISLLLADLDNTLAPYGAPLPSGEVRAWGQALSSHGVRLFVLSNNRRAERPRVFCEALDIPYIGHAGKPKPASFHAAMERMGATPAQTAIVGDQIFTDILGGRRAGVATILVKPIRLAGNPGRYLRYAAELPFRALSGRMKKEEKH